MDLKKTYLKKIGKINLIDSKEIIFIYKDENIEDFINREVEIIDQFIYVKDSQYLLDNNNNITVNNIEPNDKYNNTIINLKDPNNVNGGNP